MSERPASLLREGEDVQWDNPSTSSMRAKYETVIRKAQVSNLLSGCSQCRALKIIWQGSILAYCADVNHGPLGFRGCVR